MRTVVLCATLAAVILPFSAGAQSLPLTEADALARLSADSPRVRAIAAGIDVARADVLAAGRWPNPRVTFNREAVAGVTENMVMVASRCRSPAGAASRCRRRRPGSRPARAAPTTRCGACAPTCGWPSRSWLPPRCASGSWRQRATACVAFAEVLAKREAAGDAAGFDRLRAEREVLDVDADRAAAARTARARRRRWPRSSSIAVDPSGLVAVDGVDDAAHAAAARGAGGAGRSHPRRAARRCARRSRRRGFAARGRPAACSRAGNRRRHQVVHRRRRRFGSVISVHAIVAAVRSRPSRTRAGGRAGVRREARSTRSASTLRAEIAALPRRGGRAARQPPIATGPPP